MSSELIIRLDKRTIVDISIIVSLILLGLFVIYTDYTMTYKWIIPLDSPKDIFLFYKLSALIQIHSVVDEGVQLVFIEGINTHLRLYSTSDYAVIKASGVSIYTLTIVFSSILVFLIIKRSVKKYLDKTRWLYIISSIILTALFTIPLLAQLVFIYHGVSIGYSVEEYYTNIELKEQQYRIVDINGTRYAIYLFNDNISGDNVTLVSYKLRVGDASLPIMIFEYGIDGKINRNFTYTGSIFIKRGDINITVLSLTPLTNTSLVYYKAVFRYMGDPSAILLVFPLLCLAVASTGGIILVRMSGTKLKEIPVKED